MTRKDFELIAGALFRSHPTNETREAMATWERVRDTLADALYGTNGAFDRDKFERYAQFGNYRGGK